MSNRFVFNIPHSPTARGDVTSFNKGPFTRLHRASVAFDHLWRTDAQVRTVNTVSTRWHHTSLLSRYSKWRRIPSKATSTLNSTHPRVIRRCWDASAYENFAVNSHSPTRRYYQFAAKNSTKNHPLRGRISGFPIVSFVTVRHLNSPRLNRNTFPPYLKLQSTSYRLPMHKSKVPVERIRYLIFF